MISRIEWFNVAEMNSGNDLEVRCGRDWRVETQSSGYNVPSQAACAI
uniref:Uncharacterized protein n=1 Tax=Rhizophora mucronata TaxID=61149 RepID=A0A2P2Q0R0_RHIMU